MLVEEALPEAVNLLGLAILGGAGWPPWRDTVSRHGRSRASLDRQEVQYSVSGQTTADLRTAPLLVEPRIDREASRCEELIHPSSK